MPPKPSKWMINKTNLALPGNKGFHSGNFSPGNHFHRGHSWRHTGSFPAPLQSRASRDCQRRRPALGCSRRVQVLPWPCLHGFPPSKALVLRGSSPRPRRRWGHRSPRGTERVAFWVCWSPGEAPVPPHSSPGLRAGTRSGPADPPRANKTPNLQRKKPLPAAQGSSFQATQQESKQWEEGRDTHRDMSRGGQSSNPGCSLHCPELDFEGPTQHGTARPRAEGLTAKLVEGWTGAVTTPAPAGTVPIASPARLQANPRCRQAAHPPLDHRTTA